jgi:hypothetical protein
VAVPGTSLFSTWQDHPNSALNTQTPLLFFLSFVVTVTSLFFSFLFCSCGLPLKILHYRPILAANLIFSLNMQTNAQARSPAQV